MELARASQEEKEHQIRELRHFQSRHEDVVDASLRRLKETAANDGNIFAELMETVRVASLGQITNALYEVGGSTVVICKVVKYALAMCKGDIY